MGPSAWWFPRHLLSVQPGPRNLGAQWRLFNGDSRDRNFCENVFSASALPLAAALHAPLLLPRQ